MYNHPMRRSERELSFEQAVEIMNSGSWGVLSTVGADGYPYGVPVNYAYDGFFVNRNQPKPCIRSSFSGFKCIY